MNFLALGEVAKRSTVLYVRVTDENKDFVEDFADRLGLSTSNLMNNILDEVRKHTKLPRKKSDSKKGNSSRGNKET
jgi:antitoxin component of RelBE/YafQ-DinJ toxin-antitoxin module